MFTILMFLAVFGVFGVVSAIVGDWKRRQRANALWREMENERKPKKPTRDDVLD